MLKARLLTAILLIPLAAGAILLLPTQAVAVLFAIIALGGAFEWAGLLGLPPLQRLLYLAGILAAMAVASFLPLTWFLGLALLGWSVPLFWVLTYPHRRPSRLAQGMAGFLALVPAWDALVALHRFSPYAVLSLMAIIWAADSAAFLVGRSLGRHKLAPRVSPGKTWEGALAGIAAGGMVAFLVAPWMDGRRPLWGALGVVTVLFSILGDLLESLVKREAGKKDSGHLLPGHGGLLDRVDSLTSAAPLFMLGLWYLESIP
ncbi:MAG: phosphatidate cytidylyltransferase [Gammaproteobacteria bacterium]|nr:MAG: phosphatidate cytidylyltransferase [Gammaproteobacteria bacterium]